MAAWIRGEFGGEWIHGYLWQSPFAVLKLPQHCQSAILQYKIKSLKENGEETDVIVKGNLAWGGGDEAHVKVERVKYHVVLVVQ